MQNFKLFLIVLAILLLADFLWLGLIAKNIYIKEYSVWLRLKDGQLQPVWWAAALVYLLFATAIVIFVFPLAQGSILRAFLYGAFLGASIYGIYNFTNLALFKDWPLKMVFIDWVWGGFVAGFVSMSSLWIYNIINKMQ